MVKLCMTYINQVDVFDTKIELIRTLKEVCDKKIFLEVKKNIFFKI